VQRDLERIGGGKTLGKREAGEEQPILAVPLQRLDLGWLVSPDPHPVAVAA
jgi:hypothetical protein